MTNLDNADEVKKLDISDMLGSIELMPKQSLQAWDEAGHIELPTEYKDVRNIVVAGLGGSALGPDCLKALFSEELKIPFEVARDYQVPGYVNEQSLVILSSYSGTTEETLAAAEDAKHRGAKLVGLSKGGALADWAKENNIPFYVFDTKYNPSNSPRMAVAYSLFGMLRFLTNLGFITVTADQARAAIDHAGVVYQQMQLSVPTADNAAKSAAQHMHGKKLMILAGAHLAGNAHIFANQTNETAKTPSAYYVFSELNHHLLEGFNFPEGLSEQVHVVVLNSKHYIQRQQDRVEITLDLLKKRNIAVEIFEPKGETPLEQVLETITFSGLTTYYLAMLNGIDPTPNPDVDYLKAELAKKGDWHERL